VQSRLKKFLLFLSDHRCDAYLVTKDVNVSYLTGTPLSEGWLFVSPKKTFYLTDARYAREAQKALRGIPVCLTTGKRSAFDVLHDLTRRLRAKRIGIDPRHCSLALYRKLKKSAPGGRVRFISRPGLVERLRVIKTPDELKRIRRAIALNQRAFGYLRRVIKPGMTEKEAFFRLEAYVRRLGAGFSFDPIIASGPNGAFPHARITDRRMRSAESVLVDMGIDVEGYKSDLTRMFFLGKIPALIREMTEIVRDSKNRAIEKIRPGIFARDIDQQARNYLDKKGLGRFFSHALGHGVGLEIHEAPKISRQSAVVLEPGMVFTVEPAVYLPGRFGIRLEDMVLVTKRGHEVLSG